MLYPIMSTSTLLSKESFIFETGDVDLIIGDTNSKESFIGKASSSALILASPVWKKFLIPPWEVSPPPPRKQIDCTDNDPEALLILLNIAHLKFDSVPKTELTTRDLFSLAILVDQYQCIDLVRPWLGTWLPDKNELIRHSTEQWLFIAWVFGREKVLEKASAGLVREAALDCNCELVNRDTGMCFPEPMPPGIIGQFPFVLLSLQSVLHC
jgi:hypothetical protein